MYGGQCFLFVNIYFEPTGLFGQIKQCLALEAVRMLDRSAPAEGLPEAKARPALHEACVHAGASGGGIATKWP